MRDVMQRQTERAHSLSPYAHRAEELCDYQVSTDSVVNFPKGALQSPKANQLNWPHWKGKCSLSCEKVYASHSLLPKSHRGGYLAFFHTMHPRAPDGARPLGKYCILECAKKNSLPMIKPNEAQYFENEIANSSNFMTVWLGWQYA